MENASKALILAASILIAIMIIALGVTIFNRAQNSADTTELDSTEITMFNKKFERYAGKQLGSQVKSLISFCISNASVNKDEPSKLPAVTCIGVTPVNDYITNLGNIRKKIVSTHTYWVECVYANNGLITSIGIYDNDPGV